MTWSAAGTAAMLCARVWTSAAQGDSPPEEIDRALRATYVTWAGADSRRVDQAARDFEAGLAAAAEQMTAEARDRALATQPVSIEDALTAIAVDRQRRPRSYEEIERAYRPDARGRVLRPPGLLPEHASETYRLAWEFFLLRPGSWLTRPAARALGAIGNPASAIVLAHASKVGVREGILGALARMPSRATADAVLSVLDVAGKEWPLGPELSELHGDWTSLFLVTVGDLPSAKQSAWLDVTRDLEEASPAFSQLSRRLRARLSISRAVKATQVTPVRLEATMLDARAVEERLDLASRDLDAALAAAAEQMTPSERDAALGRETVSIEAKLEAIAADRAGRPQVYDEIHRNYLARSRPTASEPSLQPEHVKEAYRLAWELLILTPGPRDASAGYQSRAAEALGAIGNPASAVTLLHSFGLNAERDVPLTESVQAAQRSALDALVQMPSREAAKAIAQALRWGASHVSGRYPEGSDWDPTGYVVEAIAKMPEATHAAWLAALRSPEEAEDPPALQPFARELRARLGRGARRIGRS